MNRKGQTNTDIEKKKQNMHGMHRYQAKREERMRTEACEGMLLNMPVTQLFSVLSSFFLPEVRK